MEQHEKEMVVRRIISGTVRLRVLNEFDRHVLVLLRSPSRDLRYQAQELYQATYEESALGGDYSEQELVRFLYHHRLWDQEREEEVKQLEHDIEQFKTGLVGMVFRTGERMKTKLALEAAVTRLGLLYEQRHAYDHLTAHGVANMARTRFLVGTSLTYADGRPVMPPGQFEENSSVVFENAVEAYMGARLADTAFREVARSEPWRSIWAAGKHSGSVFGLPSADLSDEQVRLLSWSQVYDSVYGHPECPPDAAVEDDDILDGWLILQRRKRDQHLADKQADAALGGKARESDEVFVVVDNEEDARRVEDMNDPHARGVKKQRLDHLRKHGKVEELDMPDTKMRLQTEWMARVAAEKGQK